MLFWGLSSLYKSEIENMPGITFSLLFWAYFELTFGTQDKALFGVEIYLRRGGGSLEGYVGLLHDQKRRLVKSSNLVSCSFEAGLGLFNLQKVVLMEPAQSAGKTRCRRFAPRTSPIRAIPCHAKAIWWVGGSSLNQVQAKSQAPCRTLRRWGLFAETAFIVSA